MAYAACMNADLESADKIVCGSYFSCKRVEVTGSQTLYCSYHACDEAVLRRLVIFIFWINNLVCKSTVLV